MTQCLLLVPYGFLVSNLTVQETPLLRRKCKCVIFNWQDGLPTRSETCRNMSLCIYVCMYVCMYLTNLSYFLGRNIFSIIQNEIKWGRLKNEIMCDVVLQEVGQRQREQETDRDREKEKERERQEREREKEKGEPCKQQQRPETSIAGTAIQHYVNGRPQGSCHRQVERQIARRSLIYARFGVSLAPRPRGKATKAGNQRSRNSYPGFPPRQGPARPKPGRTPNRA